MTTEFEFLPTRFLVDGGVLDIDTKSDRKDEIVYNQVNPFAWLSMAAYETVRGMRAAKHNDISMPDWDKADPEMRAYVGSMVHMYNRNRDMPARDAHNQTLDRIKSDIFPKYEALSSRMKEQVEFFRTFVVGFLSEWQDTKA